MSSIMIVCLLGAVDEARILAVFPLHDVKSHYNVYKPLLKRLNAREVRLGRGDCHSDALPSENLLGQLQRGPLVHFIESNQYSTVNVLI